MYRLTVEVDYQNTFILFYLFNLLPVFFLFKELPANRTQTFKKLSWISISFTILGGLIIPLIHFAIYFIMLQRKVVHSPSLSGMLTTPFMMKEAIFDFSFQYLSYFFYFLSSISVSINFILQYFILLKARLISLLKDIRTIIAGLLAVSIFLFLISLYSTLHIIYDLGYESFFTMSDIYVYQPPLTNLSDNNSLFTNFLDHLHQIFGMFIITGLLIYLHKKSLSNKVTLSFSVVTVIIFLVYLLSFFLSPTTLNVQVHTNYFVINYQKLLFSSFLLFAFSAVLYHTIIFNGDKINQFFGFAHLILLVSGAALIIFALGVISHPRYMSFSDVESYNNYWLPLYHLIRASILSPLIGQVVFAVNYLLSNYSLKSDKK
jgi:hypothetical protein